MKKLTKMTDNLQELALSGRRFRIEGGALLPYAAGAGLRRVDPNVY
jgi:hypothetical protein